ncbi:MAG: alpha/beta fold hydrolase [Candidatus Acidiferrales bacterium]
MKEYFRLGLMVFVCATVAPLLHAQAAPPPAEPVAAPSGQEAQEAQAPAQTPKPIARVADYQIQEGFIDARGVMIYYMTVGRGAPIVIVHGGPGASHDYFLPYLLPLARHNRLIFIDERGSGRSQKLDDPVGYTVANMVEDVEAVRQGLVLGKITLLGHSYGGVLAQAYALKYQNNVTHLILCSTFPSTSQMNQVFVKMKEKMPPATASTARKKKGSLATARSIRRIAIPTTI